MPPGCIRTSSLAFVQGHVKVRSPVRPKTMPAYELSLVMKASLQRPELAAAIKRACVRIIQEGAVIEKLENLGERQLPVRVKAHHETHARGNYILVKFHAPSKFIPVLKEMNKQDFNIVRQGLVRDENTFVRPCLDGPCHFGELPLPTKDRRAYRKKVMKKLNIE